MNWKRLGSADGHVPRGTFLVGLGDKPSIASRSIQEIVPRGTHAQARLQNPALRKRSPVAPQTIFGNLTEHQGVTRRVQHVELVHAVERGPNRTDLIPLAPQLLVQQE